MIYLTGDTHAEFSRFNTKNFPEQKEMTKDDMVIILGDFGGIWHDSREERYWLDWLNDKPFTLCFVDGNHECFTRYYSDEFPIVDFHGGKAHQIRDSVYHLMRGYVFDFEDQSFFVMGGASSHDIWDGILDPDDFPSNEAFMSTYKEWCRLRKMFRVNKISWWKEEIPSDEELQRGLDNLKAHDNKVDFVLSHCLPQDIAFQVGAHDSDKLTLYFSKLLQDGLQFSHWYAGHYHVNERIFGKFDVLYEDIIRIA